MKVYNVVGYACLLLYAAASAHLAPPHLGPWAGLGIGMAYLLACWFVAGVYLSCVIHMGIAHRALDYKEWFVKGLTLVNNSLGVYVAPGERYAVEAPGVGLVAMAVRMEPGPTPEGWQRRTVARWAEQEPHRAGKDREFRLLACPRAATVFVGTIPVGRARDHYHHYEEVAYVLEGTGVMHMDGEPDVAIRPGLCIHFRPRLPHCLENTGDAPIRILGVFTPPVSPGEAFNMDGR